MDEKNTDFEIKEDERQSWFSLAMIWTGSMVCIPCLMIGGLLSQGLTFPWIALSVVLGYGIVCIYMCFNGMEGCDTGLPTVSMAASVMGRKGAKYIISLLLAIACVGWFGIQANVCGTSFSTMLSGMTGIHMPVWLSSCIWGVVMLLTAVFGYNAMKYLNFIAVPALVLVLGYGVIATFSQYNVSEVLKTTEPAAPFSLVTGIGLVVATFALGGVISSDFSRFAKNRSDVIKSSVLGVLPSGFVVIALGAVMTIVTGEYDISAVLTSLGLPSIGLVALVLATWTTNVTNAYSGGLAVSDIFGCGEDKRPMMTAIAGLLGTVLAAVGFMSVFEGFLNILTAFIPPVAGVIIGGYWIIGKGKKENFSISVDYNWAGIIAFVLGAAVAYITGNIVPFLISPINGIVVSIAAYVLLHKLFDKSNVAATNQI